MSSRGMVSSSKTILYWLSLLRDLIKIIQRSPTQCGEITVFSDLEGTHYRVVLLKKYRDSENNCPASSASTIAVSSIRPLAQFMIIAPFFICFIAFCLLDSFYRHLAAVKCDNI